MQELQNTSKWHDRILASFIFFTRLPLWRLRQPHVDAYRSVVEHWPLTGWLTGGMMATTLYLCSLIMPMHIAVLIAISVRLLLTGALHEDGLADFFDGFGGGSTRQRMLDIMKDSHIGTYGVLGLAMYELLLWNSLCAMPPIIAVLAIIAADPYSKMLSATLANIMPYARKKEEAKAKTIYRKAGTKAWLSLITQGFLPMLPLLIVSHISWIAVMAVPCISLSVMLCIIWNKLHGYTGDCCGATCLVTELSVYLTINILTTI